MNKVKNHNVINHENIIESFRNSPELLDLEKERIECFFKMKFDEKARFFLWDLMNPSRTEPMTNRISVNNAFLLFEWINDILNVYRKCSK